jgi:hypothetical protein
MFCDARQSILPIAGAPDIIWRQHPIQWSWIHISVQCMFSLSIEPLQVISMFCLLYNGIHAILSAKRRCRKKRLPFDSSTWILYRWSVEIFRLSLAIHKLLSYFHYAFGFDWVLPFETVFVNLTPKCPRYQTFLIVYCASLRDAH